METAHFDEFLASLEPAFKDGDPDAHTKTTEAANIHKLRELYAAIGRNDMATLFVNFTEDVEFEVIGPPGAPFVNRKQGRRQVAEVIRQNFGKVDNLRPEVLHLVAQGDTVVVCGRDQGHYVPTKRDFVIHWVHFFTFRNGRISRMRQLFDTATVMALAAG